MPGGITRVGDTATTFDPCNVTGVTTIAGPGAASPTGGVFVNGKPAATLGDLTAPYPSGIPPVCVAITKPIVGPGAPGLSGVYVNNKIVSTVADTVGSGVVTTASGVENPLTGVFAGTIVAGPPNP